MTKVGIIRRENGRKAVKVALGILFVAALLFLGKLLTSAPAHYRDASRPLDERVEDLLSRMTLQEKIGQMTLVEKDSLDKEKDIAAYGIGALLSGGGGKPENNSPRGWRDMVAKFTRRARASRLGIPLLYGADANHGTGNVPGATIFPHAIGLGAANDPLLVEQIARATAEESTATGILWNFSPMLELPRDMRWGRVYEAYSDDPKRVADLGAAYVRGLQNAPENEGKIAVLASAKHYIGLGSLTWGTAANPSYEIDQGNVPENEQALRSQYLPPFQAAIDAGAMNVMAAIGSWGDTHIAASKYLLSDVLKDDLGFRGFVVSDWYGVNNISPNTYDATVSAVNAGIDMSMVPYDYQTFIADMKKAVASGDISEARVDDAVRRILRAKFALGLFDDRGPSLPSLKIVGSAEHRALAREAVQRSLVLLKNTNGVLPISSDIQSIRVAGSAADNIGRQAGGWTVEWQGIDGNWLPGATSILAGIRATASKETSVEYDLNGNFGGDELADVGIAIVGEKPYAEGVGDNAHPSLDSADLSAIENLRKSSREVIVVLISGRPLIISDELPKWDALVAAWLPGSEGAGVADALFGASSFTGTLPLSWTGLFPRGYGLK